MVYLQNDVHIHMEVNRQTQMYIFTWKLTDKHRCTYSHGSKQTNTDVHIHMEVNRQTQMYIFTWK